jgi:hypothetical protein
MLRTEISKKCAGERGSLPRGEKKRRERMNDDKRLVILVSDENLVNAFEEIISPAPMQTAIEMFMQAIVSGNMTIEAEKIGEDYDS